MASVYPGRVLSFTSIPGHLGNVGLDTAGSVAIENAKIYKELRRGRLEPSLASRLNQILINQRVILDSFDAEKRIQQLEGLLEKAGQGKLIQLKTVNG